MLHDEEHHMAAFFTNIPDLDREVLLGLPYPDLLQACQVNRVTQAVCKDPYFWKERLQREYGGIPFPENSNYEQQYRRLMEFRTDPELFRKYPSYREAFAVLFEEPEVFYESMQENPTYTLTDYAFEYGLLDSSFELAKHRLRQGNQILAGVYRQLTSQPDFTVEINILSELAAKYPQFLTIGEIFASDPADHRGERNTSTT